MTTFMTISREDLLHPLQTICTVVEKKQTLPILSNVLITAKDQQVTFTATDLEVEIVTHSAIEQAEEGSITVPARKLLDICKSLPEDSTVSLTLQENRLLVRAAQSRFTLSTLPAEEYPHIDTGSAEVQFVLTESALKRLLEKTSFAMAQQDVRYYLNGVLLEVSGNQVKVVATDGHRLALSATEMAGAVEQAKQVIVPRKGALELLRLLSDSDNEVKLEIGANFIQAALPNLTFTSKLIEGRYPDYKNVIPKNGNKTLVADRETLKHALGRAAILSHDKHRSIRAQINEKVKKIFAVNAENEQSEEEVPVHYDGEALEIGLNVNYLKDVLDVIPTNNVKMTLTDSNSSILVEAGEEAGDSSLYVIMPMRL